MAHTRAAAAHSSRPRGVGRSREMVLEIAGVVLEIARDRVARGA